MPEAAIQHRVPVARPATLSGEPAVWDEFDVRAALAGYGVPIAAEELAGSADAACAAADRVGYPVALKIVAGNLTHKSDHGAVRLGLADVTAVRLAFDELEQVAHSLVGVTHRGVSVQTMVPPGTELILGTRTDAVFGRTLMLGWGGLWVEAFPNPQLGSVPVSPERAWDMIERLFGPALPRARVVADLEALHTAVLTFSDFVADLPSTVDVVEINPLILSFGASAGVTAIDAAVGGFTAPSSPGHAS